MAAHPPDDPDREGGSPATASYRWVDILWYRGFYDIPRLLCVRARTGHLLLDSAFNNDLDEYETHYAVRFVPAPGERSDADEDRVLREADGQPRLGTLEVTRELFDITRRAQVRVPTEWLER